MLEESENRLRSRSSWYRPGFLLEPVPIQARDDADSTPGLTRTVMGANRLTSRIAIGNKFRLFLLKPSGYLHG
jgi:hypothetical protein